MRAAHDTYHLECTTILKLSACEDETLLVRRHPFAIQYEKLERIDGQVRIDLVRLLLPFQIHDVNLHGWQASVSDRSASHLLGRPWSTGGLVAVEAFDAEIVFFFRSISGLDFVREFFQTLHGSLRDRSQGIRHLRRIVAVVQSSDRIERYRDRDVDRHRCVLSSFCLEEVLRAGVRDDRVPSE